ncbi:hypothetical protein BFJ71_g23 [Fusarium oxysporum]|nr:hypothetical protein BFJ71_g23 [Fusarium oxysporum]
MYQSARASRSALAATAQGSKMNCSKPVGKTRIRRWNRQQF